MSTKVTPVTPLQKAAFREEARRIVRADRAAKLSGASQNTIGAVATALERAFKLGRDGGYDAGPSEPTWESIPPRAREALSYLGARARPVHGCPAQDLTLIRFEHEGRTRWRIEEERADARTYPSVAIDPLLKLGLLRPIAERPEALELSPSGISAFDGYWARRLAQDRTLPLEGMRPTKRGY